MIEPIKSREEGFAEITGNLERERGEFDGRQLLHMYRYLGYLGLG